MFKKIVLVLVLGIAGLLTYASTRPDQYHVERAILIHAPAETIFPQLNDLKAGANWSPWEKMDPQMKKTFSGSETGVGSSYQWEGNKDVGQGRMTIIESTPPTSVTYRLEFIKPFKGEAVGHFHLLSEGSNTKVTWSMDGKSNLITKVIGIFMDCEKMIGEQFEKGLVNLKALTESSKP